MRRTEIVCFILTIVLWVATTVAAFTFGSPTTGIVLASGFPLLSAAVFVATLLWTTDRQLRKSRARRLRYAATTAAAFCPFIYVFTSWPGVFPIQITGSIVGVSLVLFVAAAIAESLETDSAIVAKEAQIRDHETEPTKEQPIVDVLMRQIKIAVNRQEITMLRAEKRSSTLYTLGQLFLLASICGPILAGTVYWFVDPLPESTVARLKELNDTLGSLPDGSSITTQRDWRILLAGVTFGFLLLAAAGGLLRQQGKEIAIYFRVAERINHFERLASAIQLRSRLSDAGGDEKQLVKLVVDNLLSPQASTKADGVGDEKQSSSDDTSALLKVVDALKGITT